MSIIQGIFDFIYNKKRRLNPAFGAEELPTYGTGEPTSSQYVGSQGIVDPSVVQKYGTTSPYVRPSLGNWIFSPSTARDISNTNRAFELAPLQARQAFGLEQEQWGPRLNNLLTQRSALADLDFNKSQQYRPILEAQELALEKRRQDQANKSALELDQSKLDQDKRQKISIAAQLRPFLPEPMWDNTDEENALLLGSDPTYAGIERQALAMYNMANKNPQKKVLATGQQLNADVAVAQATQQLVPARTADELADLQEKATLRPAKAKLNQFEANTGITPAQAINLGWIPTPTEQGFSFSKSPIPSPEEEMMQSLIGDPLSVAADSAGIPKLAPEISMIGQPTRRAMVAPAAAAKETTTTTTTTKEKTPPPASPPNQAPTRPTAAKVSYARNPRTGATIGVPTAGWARPLEEKQLLRKALVIASKTGLNLLETIDALRRGDAPNYFSYTE